MLLEEGLGKIGLTSIEKMAPLLFRYIKEIELFNEAYGLVKVSGRRELVIKHILDSLAPLPSVLAPVISLVTRKPCRIADVGSGAGLPGIPLAVCLAAESLIPAENKFQAEVTLIERMGRRAGFLQNTIASLGLAKVSIVQEEMEKLPLKPENGFDLIVFRAFKPLEKAFLKDLLKLLNDGGTLAAYKGRRQVIEEELSGLEELRNTNRLNISWEIYPLEVPFLEEERHLVLLRKA